MAKREKKKVILEHIFSGNSQDEKISDDLNNN